MILVKISSTKFFELFEKCNVKLANCFEATYGCESFTTDHFYGYVTLVFATDQQAFWFRLKHL